MGLRTASHAFENWKTFDKEVWGGNYQNHHGNKLKTAVTVEAAADHPILRGVAGFISDGSLYKNTPLQPKTTVLLRGKAEGHPAEPVAWTHDLDGRRIFYTSLGHPNDFKEEAFRKLLLNAIEWSLGKPLEKREQSKTDKSLE
jgi:type 1 glutamine amidotransferase